MRKFLVFFSLVFVLPGLIIFNYKRQLWNNCGKYIKEQNSIWQKEVKPEIDKSISEIFVDTAALDQDFAEKYIALTNNSLKLFSSWYKKRYSFDNELLIEKLKNNHKYYIS